MVKLMKVWLTLAFGLILSLGLFTTGASAHSVTPNSQNVSVSSTTGTHVALPDTNVQQMDSQQSDILPGRRIVFRRVCFFRRVFIGRHFVFRRSCFFRRVVVFNRMFVTRHVGFHRVGFRRVGFHRVVTRTRISQRIGITRVGMRRGMR